MNHQIKKEILADRQIKKFSLYGFLKNLKFFEPYLLIFLTGNGLNLLQVGLLLSIREIIVNVFEIPSGIIADYFGRKRELCFSFAFYIFSFVLFFFCDHFWLAVLAMIFFGLGEAFRSGTHKAMIYTYLEEQNWQDYKTFVYGKTRSSSLIGSALSSLLGILIIILMPRSNYIFLASIVPYILDFLLILSYPSSLDRENCQKNLSLKKMLFSLSKNIFKKKELRHILLGNGFLEAVISSSKDFIQPILEALILGAGVIFISSFSPENNLKISLGLIYAVISLVGAYSSRKAYCLQKRRSDLSNLNLLYLLLAVVFASLGLFLEQLYFVCFAFLAMKVLQNCRKPIFVAEIDSYMEKSERASVLSVASQLKSLLIIFLAPLVGWLADTYGMSMVMYSLAALLLIVYPFSYLQKK